MNEQQMSQLKALPFPVFYFYGDDDLSLTNVEVGDHGPCGPYYVITYSNGMGGQAKIYGCVGGVGEVMPGFKQVNFSSLLYGSGVAEVYDDNSEEKLSFRSHWLTWREGAFYSFSGEGLAERFISKIVEGLVELE